MAFKFSLFGGARNLGALALISALATALMTACGGGSGSSIDNGGATAKASLALFAGNMGGPGSVDGTGAAARFNAPAGTAVDGAGNLYIADRDNNLIRKVTPAGAVTTLAGSGVAGSADGVGTAAAFNKPFGVAIDGIGNLYVADTYNATIRKITPAGVVSTLAGTPGAVGSKDGVGAAASFGAQVCFQGSCWNEGALGVATDSSGNVYAADLLNSTVRKITPAGVVSTLAGSAGMPGSADGMGAAARFGYPPLGVLLGRGPAGIAADGAGNVYLTDIANTTIRKITPAGAVTTLAGTASVFVSFHADGTGAAASFGTLAGLAIDGSGNLYATDETVRKITPAGVVTTLAGDWRATYPYIDGAGSVARFSNPSGIAVDAAGTVYVADTRNNAIRKVSPAGTVSLLAGAPVMVGYDDGVGAAARFFFLEGIAADSAGNLYVADFFACTIRKITPAAAVSTLAGTRSGCNHADGTGDAARFNGPAAVAVDGGGNVYVADFWSSVVRKITPAGVVSTLAGKPGVSGNADGTGAAAQFSELRGIAVDSAGNVYVTDANTIRKITPGGTVSTFAGSGAGSYLDGAGAAARFNSPAGIAVDNAGNVYVADPYNNVIRKITTAGVVSTLAGVATSGNADGAGAAARFYFPQAIAVDGAGNLYVADDGNSEIRKVTPAGVVSTVAHSFIPGALPGGVSTPSGVAVSGASLYITTRSGVAVINNLP